MARAIPELPGIAALFSRFGEVEDLQSKVRTHIAAIRDLFARIAHAVGGRDGAVRRRRGRPPKAAAASSAEAGRGRRMGPRVRRAKRGALRAAVHRALAGGKVARAKDVVKSLLKSGYKTASKPNVFYNSVYLAMRKDKGIEKVGKKFKLKAGAKA